MGLESGLVKKLLLIACILGVLQGLLTLVGGIIACFDRNKDVIFKSYCSSMTPMIRIFLVTVISRSSSRENLASHQTVNAILKRWIEVGSRESISGVRIVRMMRMVRDALQEVIPFSLLCLLLLYVVFFGL